MNSSLAFPAKLLVKKAGNPLKPSPMVYSGGRIIPNVCEKQLKMDTKTIPLGL